MKQTTNKRPTTKRPADPNTAAARPNSVPDAESAPLPATSAAMPQKKYAPVPRLEPPTPSSAPAPRKLPMGQKSPPRPARPAGGVPRLSAQQLPKPLAAPAAKLDTAAPAAKLDTAARPVEAHPTEDAERMDPRTEPATDASPWAEPIERPSDEPTAIAASGDAALIGTPDGAHTPADTTPPATAVKTPKHSKGKKRPGRMAKVAHRETTTVPVRSYADLAGTVKTADAASSETSDPAHTEADDVAHTETDPGAHGATDDVAHGETDAAHDETGEAPHGEADEAALDETEKASHGEADTAAPAESDATDVHADTTPETDVVETSDDAADQHPRSVSGTAPESETVAEWRGTVHHKAPAAGPILKPKAAPVPKLRPAAKAAGAAAGVIGTAAANPAAPAALATKKAPEPPLTKVADARAATAPGRKTRTWRSGNLATFVSLVPILALVVLLVVSTVAALTVTAPPAQVAASGWLTDNVDRDQRLIVDQAMADDLRAAGWDGDDALWAVPAGGTGGESPNSWRDADYVVTTDALRDGSEASPQIGSAIANSVSVAAFGSGDDVVEVRQIVPEGAVLASVAETRSTATRAQFGTELAQNSAVVLSESDRSLLTVGRVDTRIISVLGALAAEGEVTVAGFPVVDGESGRPIRQVVISAVGDEPLVADGQRTAAATVLIDGLLGRFAPDDVSVRAGSIILRYSSSVDAFLD